jgi:hypothetical protein
MLAQSASLKVAAPNGPSDTSNVKTNKAWTQNLELGPRLIIIHHKVTEWLEHPTQDASGA